MIRRVTAALDSRFYRVVPIAAPTDEEAAHPYMWRFWRHLPRAGHTTLFDRSWYGRVLVERVEGLAGEAEWKRAYKEINEFEDQLRRHGIWLVKFWLHIDKSARALVVDLASSVRGLRCAPARPAPHAGERRR